MPDEIIEDEFDYYDFDEFSNDIGYDNSDQEN